MPHHLVVDAMNVIGSRPTGWWRDRDAAVRALVARLHGLAAAHDGDVVMVVDGRPLSDLPEGKHGRVRVLYAQGGRNAADDRIIEVLEADPEPAAFDVVTSDRELARRAQERGARVRGPSSLLAELDQLDRTHPL